LPSSVLKTKPKNHINFLTIRRLTNHYASPGATASLCDRPIPPTPTACRSIASIRPIPLCFGAPIRNGSMRPLHIMRESVPLSKSYDTTSAPATAKALRTGHTKRPIILRPTTIATINGSFAGKAPTEKLSLLFTTNGMMTPKTYSEYKLHNGSPSTSPPANLKNSLPFGVAISPGTATLIKLPCRKQKREAPNSGCLPSPTYPSFSNIALLNAGISSGLRLVMMLPSITTSSSTHSPPALRISSCTVK